jgi:hypothetical protein
MPHGDLKSLQAAENLLAESQRRIERQRERMVRMRRDGHSRAAQTAESVLLTLLEAHATLEAHRQTILRALEQTETPF